MSEPTPQPTHKEIAAELRTAFRAGDWENVLALADRLDPPRPAVPTARWSVVECDDGREWCLIGTNVWPWVTSDSSPLRNPSYWRDDTWIAEHIVRVIRDGVS